MKRSEQKVENTWRLEDIYENDSKFYEETKIVEDLLNTFYNYAGKLNNVDMLVEAIQVYEKINYYFGRIYVYANQRSHEDTTNPTYQKMVGEAQMILVKLSTLTSWFEPELLSSDINLEDDKLKLYKRMLTMILNQKEHVLDARTEELLASASDLGNAADSIFSMFNNADIKFDDCIDKDGKAHPLTHGTYSTYMESDDRILRKSAFENIYAKYKQFNNTLATTYYANAKQADFFSRVHKYASTFDSELSHNEIPLYVYDNLIDATHDKLDAMYTYVSLRKKALHVEELHMYDVYAPLVKDVDKKYSFDEAKKMVKEGLSILGDDYISILEEGFNNRWIDIYENEGKRSGAYSWGCYGTHPYVLLNYHETLDNVFTLAHEMGHAIHTYYSNSNQDIFNAEYRIFVAEVASTCNESLLIHHLMNQTKDIKEKKYLINHFLDQFKGTMFRQTMFAEFERITHDMVSKEEILTAKSLNEIYYNLNKLYFGDDMISDEEIQYEWSRIPHFYTPFYVYQYATSFAAAIAISQKILNKEEGIVEKYKQFLSGGCSMTPIELLKICDVDMSKKEPIEMALDVFAKYVNEFEKLL
ncbi:MAG: oligoendopeptidase F [Holdemanella sp.]|nr:oligoendopeptidase F [Holdemanella sp.]